MQAIPLNIALIILIALAQYLFFTFRVGTARGKYNVPAPKTTGNETWERLYRVQMNTAELLIVFIPAVVMFAHFVSATWALVPGIAFIVGRALYARLYVSNPASRTPGAALSLLSNIGMVVITLIVVIVDIVK